MLEGCTLARRIGKSLCIADRENYNIVDLDSAMVTPVLPLNQAGDPSMQIKPSITVVADFEFLVASWTGMSSMGVFLTTSGDPTRGTLDWPSHPDSVCESCLLC
jgi:vacuolar protein sorting-associated protein 3